MANRLHSNPHAKATTSAWLRTMIEALATAGADLGPASAPLPAQPPLPPLPPPAERATTRPDQPAPPAPAPAAQPAPQAVPPAPPQPPPATGGSSPVQQTK